MSASTFEQVIQSMVTESEASEVRLREAFALAYASHECMPAMKYRNRLVEVPEERPDHVLPRDWDILVRRKQGVTLRAISEHYGISQGRVRQLSQKAMHRLLYGPPKLTVQYKYAKPAKD